MRRKEAGFIAAQAAIFAAVIALVSLPLQSASETQVSTSSGPNAGPLVLASGVSPEGLQLRMTLNSSSAHLHGAVSGQINVLDTLDRNVTISNLVRNQDVSRWSTYDAGCPSDSVLGFAVFGGRFTAANISAAGSPFQLTPQFISSCGSGGVGWNAVRFLPGGGEAVGAFNASQPNGFFLQVATELNVTTILCNGGVVGNGGFGCSSSYPGLVGYWNYSIPGGGNLGFTSPAFVYFPPGEYTVVAADDWDQYLYATFTVRAADTTLTSSATSDAAACGVGNQVITLNSTEYCADDVANDAAIGSPGYSYFRNDSVTFEGVKFQTICPSSYRGCPGANGSASLVMLGIMRFTMTFPDNTNETASSVIADFSYAQILSNHSDPRAGMLIEITYGAHATTHVYLLVEKQP